MELLYYFLYQKRFKKLNELLSSIKTLRESKDKGNGEGQDDNSIS